MKVWDLPKRLCGGWCRFWFESDGKAQMRLFRITFGLVLLCCYTLRSLDLDFFYSDSGLVKSWVLSDLMPMHYRFSLLTLFPGHGALWIFNGLFLASLVTLTLGFWPRISALAA